MKNPHDGAFKDLAEDHPELLLRLLGILQPGTKTKIKHVLRDLRLNEVHIDHAYRMEDDTGSWVEMFEAITSWHAEKIGTMALYNFLIQHKEDLPVFNHVLFMAEKYAPKDLPDRLVHEGKSGLRIEVPYQAHRLWEVDPALCFEPACEELLPWAPLLKGGLAEFERTTVAMERLFEDREKAGALKPAVLVSKLASLASLRYDKSAIKWFLERLEKKIMLSTDAFKVSWLYQEGLEEGKAEGIAAGKAEGKAEGKSEAIRIILSDRFPALGLAAELNHVRPESLDTLLTAILKAQNPEDARAAILVAVDANKAS